MLELSPKRLQQLKRQDSALAATRLGMKGREARYDVAAVHRWAMARQREELEANAEARIEPHDSQTGRNDRRT